MNQPEQQLRLTVEEIRERQEWELVNNREFGLLHNVDYGPPAATVSFPSMYRTSRPTPSPGSCAGRQTTWSQASRTRS